MSVGTATGLLRTRSAPALVLMLVGGASRAKRRPKGSTWTSMAKTRAIETARQVTRLWWLFLITGIAWVLDRVHGAGLRSDHAGHDRLPRRLRAHRGGHQRVRGDRRSSRTGSGCTACWACCSSSPGSWRCVAVPDVRDPRPADRLVPAVQGHLRHHLQHPRTGRAALWGLVLGAGIVELVDRRLGDRLPRPLGVAARAVGRHRRPHARHHRDRARLQAPRCTHAEPSRIEPDSNKDEP